MTVTVRDRRGPPYDLTLLRVTVSDRCPACGGPRGEPRDVQHYDDGDTYTVSVWANPCGHLDLYSEVIAEWEAMAEAAAPVEGGAP